MDEDEGYGGVCAEAESLVGENTEVESQEGDFSHDLGCDVG